MGSLKKRNLSFQGFKNDLFGDIQNRSDRRIPCGCWVYESVDKKDIVESLIEVGFVVPVQVSTLRRLLAIVAWFVT